jgi:hypothetical protein
MGREEKRKERKERKKILHVVKREGGKGASLVKVPVWIARIGDSGFEVPHWDGSGWIRVKTPVFSFGVFLKFFY